MNLTLRFFIICYFIVIQFFIAQNSDSTGHSVKKHTDLKIKLNKTGSHYFQITFLNQTWLRHTEHNDSTTVFNKSLNNSFDIGLRRTRIQMIGQITDRAFIYFQFGQNNFNNAYNYTSNRKIAAFFHDAICEYKISKSNQLKIGGGLTVLNGLSRFSQPSIGSIMTLDVPVFLQYSVDQIDQFDRRLAVYARGQVYKLDYRIYVSNPFPINSNGSTPPPINKNATFVDTKEFSNGKSPGINNQFGGYLSYNLFDEESHTTPYMTGTYLGKKKVWNIAIGGVYQKDATWFLSKNVNTGNYTDTSFANMIHLSFETFLDIPLNEDKTNALSAFAGYYNTNYGQNYLRYNGIMNPATGTTANNLLQSNAFGNAFPMFGTGHVGYLQFGYLFPKKFLGENNGQLMPYLSAQYADFTALQHKGMLLWNVGFNWLINGHNSKISIDYQSRPTYYLAPNNDVLLGSRKGAFTLQYQIYF